VKIAETYSSMGKTSEARFWWKKIVDFTPEPEPEVLIQAWKEITTILEDKENNFIQDQQQVRLKKAQAPLPPKTTAPPAKSTAKQSEPVFLPPKTTTAPANNNNNSIALALQIQYLTEEDALKNFEFEEVIDQPLNMSSWI
jgi:hypothetical protein